MLSRLSEYHEMIGFEKTEKALLNILEDMDENNRALKKTKGELANSVKKLRDLDKKKDEFLSITAHELKTPLTSIKGFTELLKKPKAIKNKKIRTKYIDFILADTRRLEHLVEETLDLTRLDLGTFKFSYETVAIDTLISDLKALIDIAVRKKGLTPKYNFKKNLPDFYIDKQRLLQVLTNLINNAIKYTEKGHILTEVVKKGNYLHFSVTDTGVGIPKKEFNKIFGRFYQVDSSYTRKVGGSGLGLSICKSIVEAFGGKIWVNSVIGKGTTFEFTVLLKTPTDNKN